ncbi:MAG: hypothetical protein KAS62_09515, partial [Candidatus Delongbacteria bacterium]|nr:hypothetical protein [Candidatus Delongbacteria bacterium]
SGTVSLDHGFAVASDVTVTVTGFNLETEQSVMMVTGDLGGTFSLDNSSLSYGNVTVNGNSTLQFTITNSHNSETIVGDITTITGYTVANAAKNTLGYAVPTNSSKTFDLVFTPTAQTTYSGNITITSSDPAHDPEYIAVTGTCVVPDIDIPIDLSASTAPETSVIKNFDIDNLAAGTLDYSIAINYTSGKDIKASGGPDTYGYKWKDSDEIGGPVYNWVEINGSGTALGLSDDGESAALNLGFTFNYYGVDYTTIVVSSNGAASLTETDVTYNNTNIPTGSGEKAILAPFWDDLNPTSGGEVYYYADGANNRFIIEWDGVVDYGSTTPNTFQIILTDNGKILYQYKDMQGDLVGCTVGIGDHTGADGNLVVANAAYLKNNLAVEFGATPEWLSLDATTGSIAGSGTDVIAATCDAAGLELGVYTADIIISSNDPDESTKILPVTFTVSDAVLPPENPATTTVTATEANLSWDAVAGATIYYIYRSTDPYSGFVQIGTSATPDYQDSDVTGSNKYFYYITADNTKK